MSQINKIIQQLIIALNGAFIGAMVLIGVVLVPFWQSSEPQTFLNWFTEYGNTIGGIMIPLGPGVLILSILTFFLSSENKKLWALTSVFILINVIYFPAYYLPTNSSFAEQTIALTQVSAELSTWLSFHWQRVLFASFALITSIMAVVKK